MNDWIGVCNFIPSGWHNIQTLIDEGTTPKSSLYQMVFNFIVIVNILLSFVQLTL